MAGANKVVQGNVRGRDDLSEVLAYSSQHMLSIGGVRPDGGDSSSSPACHCRAAEVNNAERSGMSGPEPQLAKHVLCVCRGWGEYLQMDGE